MGPWKKNYKISKIFIGKHKKIKIIKYKSKPLNDSQDHLWILEEHHPVEK